MSNDDAPETDPRGESAGGTGHGASTGRSWVRWGLTRGLPLAVLAFVLIQFIPYRAGNPSTRDEPKWDSPQTRELAVRACYDCHSNQTTSHIYTKVAPISWWTANHVKEGRAALNFSEWHTNAGYHADESWEAVGENMPPDYYYWLGRHSNAKLTAAEKQQLMDGLQATTAADPPTGGGSGGEGGEGGGN